MITKLKKNAANFFSEVCRFFKVFYNQRTLSIKHLNGYSNQYFSGPCRPIPGT